MAAGITIEVPGTPVAKGRPRLSTQGGFARAFTPAKTRRYEDLVRLAAGEAMRGRDLLDGPLAVRVEAHVPIPQSLSNKRRAMAIAGDIKPVTRPDLDNYIKVLDGLNGIVWRDDSQIVELVSSKVYSDRPRLVVTAHELLPAAQQALAA